MDFQTPDWCCEFMRDYLPDRAGTILEPTPGEGRLVKWLEPRGVVYAPTEFFDVSPDARFDWIVMNPPFTPMQLGYDILYRCMGMSDNIIALMPWLTIINSEKRTKNIMEFGLVSITHLPRKTFAGSRVQTCILEMRKGYKNETVFTTYEQVISKFRS